MNKYMCIFIVLCLSGCGSTMVIERRYPDNKVHTIRIKGQMKATIKTEGEEITVDSKSEPLIKDLVSVNGMREVGGK